ncbi:MAG TPA: VWA domain-containing protein [Terriglobia bacterium]|nr:VWA domain-containing protein [Terriglobia bacterium]
MAVPVGESVRVGLSVLRQFVILSLLTFASQGLGAQAVPAPATTASQASAPTFKLQVQKNVVVVRVVVRDPHGRAVAGLRQEDFRITDNRKPQTISSFSVETHPVAIPLAGLPATAPPAKMAEGPKQKATPVALPTYLGLYFDDLNSAFDSLVRARDAAEKFIAGVPPTERIAILTSSGKQSLDFTNDRQKLHEALFRLYANERLNPRASCPEITDFLADQITNHEDSNAYSIVRDEAINECQMDARSVTNQWIRMLAQAAYDAFLMQARVDIKNLENAVQRVAEMPGERQVMLVSDGFMPLEMRDLLEHVIDEALHVKVIISALDGKGLAVQLREADASRQYAPSGNMSGLYHMYDTSREAAATGTLAEIAGATGGQFVHNSNDLLGGFRKVLLAPETAYVLTFSPENLKENGAFHTLKVRLLNGHGFTVQARKGYFAPGKPTTPEQQAKEEIREAVFSPDPIQGLPLEVQAQAHKIGPQKAEIAVQVRLDVRALSFEREGDRNINKIILTVALFDADGKFVSGKQENRELILKDTTLADLQKSGLDFQARVLVTPGTYTVRVVARDAQKGAMAAMSRAVEAPR